MQHLQLSIRDYNHRGHDQENYVLFVSVSQG